MQKLPQKHVRAAKKMSHQDELGENLKDEISAHKNPDWIWGEQDHRKTQRHRNF